MSQKKQIRDAFRRAVFARDDYCCRGCGVKGVRLDAHHITDRGEMPNGGYVIENGITLCEPCHLKAEKYHMSGGKEVEAAFHPNALYEKIGSSYEIAFEASDRLT